MIKTRITMKFAGALVGIYHCRRSFILRPGTAEGHVELTIDDKDDEFFDGLAASVGEQIIWTKSDEMPQSHWLSQLIEVKTVLAAREEKIKTMGADLEGLKNDLENTKGKKPAKKTVKFPPGADVKKD